RPLDGVLAAQPGRVVTLAGTQPSDDAVSVVVDDDGRRRTQFVRWGELTPAVVADALVLPRLGKFTTPTIEALARIFVETGEPRAAARCLDALAARGAPTDGRGLLAAELTALTDLASFAGRVVPDDVRASPEL